MNCTSTNLIYVITCAGCGHNYIGETGDVLRNRATVHKQQIRDLHTRILGVSKHIDECAAGLTPQFTIFPFYKILSPSEVMRKNKERFFISKYNPFLMTWNYANCSRALWITGAIIIAWRAATAVKRVAKKQRKGRLWFSLILIYI